jgi:hypothetical protein
LSNAYPGIFVLVCIIFIHIVVHPSVSNEKEGGTQGKKRPRKAEGAVRTEDESPSSDLEDPGKPVRKKKVLRHSSPHLTEIHGRSTRCSNWNSNPSYGLRKSSVTLPQDIHGISSLGCCYLPTLIGALHSFSARILAIHNAIKSIPENLDLSNPATFIMLPFPSPHPAPFKRFETTEEKGIEYFRYMGRSKFTKLNDYTKRSTFVRGKEDLYLYGSSGSGKSHILAAMVCQLIREGKRVVYIPDCRDLIKHPDETIRIALCCAFYDDSTSLETIESAHDVEGLLDFFGTHGDRYLIVDQLNALESSSNNDPSKRAKEEAVTLLGKMSFNHRYIYSASANEQSNRDVDLKQAPITVIPFLGGMNEVR